MLQEIKDHIEAQPKEVQEQLLKLHHSVLELSDEIEEHYGYKMPGFRYKGRVLVYYSAFKKHIGFYGFSSVFGEKDEEMQQYKGGKGTLQFPHGTEVPLGLIQRLTKARMLENEEVAAKKGKKK